jgi:hypothetical protein
LILRGLYLKEIRGFVFTLAAIFFLLAVMMVVPGYFKYRNNVHGAIILAKLTDARYEPVEKSNSHFPLYEGNKVFVLRQSDGWLKVKRPDGKIGWVPENTAVKLRPAG